MEGSTQAPGVFEPQEPGRVKDAPDPVAALPLKIRGLDDSFTSAAWAVGTVLLNDAAAESVAKP